MRPLGESGPYAGKASGSAGVMPYFNRVLRYWEGRWSDEGLLVSWVLPVGKLAHSN